MGGALLYGPPGTGKTHLARVLARESKSVMICVSAADIENKYVGETEKAIKGLFNLGRMLSPCTIFLDEADSIFRHRTFEDRQWQRNQINQLLH
jgi:SpoVK/Ycf46/Vps4 family AAA+-type ATPase